MNPRFAEWVMGLDDGWVTAVPGLSRSAVFRLLGNGVVPQQGQYALRQLLHLYQWVGELRPPLADGIG